MKQDTPKMECFWCILHQENEHGASKNKKKLSFFSVISLSRNYLEDQHWFNIAIDGGIGDN